MSNYDFIVSSSDAVTGSVSISSDEIKSAPSPCVYFLIAEGEIVYVGMTVDLKRRLSGHKWKVFDRVYWIGTVGLKTELVEAENINHHQPPLNIFFPRVDSIAMRDAPMNQAQLNLLLLNRVKCPHNREAIQLVIIDGLSAYAAEKQVYGRTTDTINRMVKEARKDYARCLEVAALA